MRIVVNDIAASTGGALTVLKEFYNCVRQNDRENQWIFLLGDHLLEETDNIKIRVLKDVKASSMKKLIFDFWTGRNYIRQLEPDVVISLQNIITFGLKTPQIVYIHQSIPFQTVKKFSFFKKSERKSAVIQYLIGGIIKRSAKKADHVVVQTQWMGQAVCKACKLPAQKVTTAMPNVKDIAQRATETTFRKDQFFYPTGGGIYKNNDAVFQASGMLAEKGVEHRVTMTLPAEKSRGRVECVGRLPYEQVLQMYQTDTLVFSSYLETFGYPLAEAAKVGTVILAADTLFAREVLNGYENAYFFDPFRPEELAALMEKVACGQILRKEIAAGEDHGRDSWLDVLELVVGFGKTVEMSK